MKILKRIITIIVLLLILTSYSVYAGDDVPKTYSPTIVLMEAKTGEVLYEKNGYTKTYPASTTKILTAILTLENCELTETAKASHTAIFSVPYGYQNVNIQVDEELSISNLLNVLMVGSANDAANVLAEHVAGSIESFASMMNAKAAELGCKNTHFVNPNGIHNSDHYTTAYDLALMARYAMQNEEFRKLVTTMDYTLPATDKFKTADRVVKQTNELLYENNSDLPDNYYYKWATRNKNGLHKCS